MDLIVYVQTCKPGLPAWGFTSGSFGFVVQSELALLATCHVFVLTLGLYAFCAHLPLDGVAQYL